MRLKVAAWRSTPRQAGRRVLLVEPAHLGDPGRHEVEHRPEVPVEPARAVLLSVIGPQLEDEDLRRTVDRPSTAAGDAATAVGGTYGGAR